MIADAETLLPLLRVAIDESNDTQSLGDPKQSSHSSKLADSDLCLGSVAAVPKNGLISLRYDLGERR